MPLIHKRELTNDTVLGIWEVTETEGELLNSFSPESDELDLLNSFSHAFRRIQFLATRLLVQTLFPGMKITYDENGKPWPTIENHHLSISHSGDYISVLVGNLPCGIDIETIREKIERIAPKFLCDEELIAAQKNPVIERMHAYWCVKEAIYKVYGMKNVSLKTDIFVQEVINPHKGSVMATLRHGDFIFSKKVYHEKFNDCMLAWTE